MVGGLATFRSSLSSFPTQLCLISVVRDLHLVWPVLLKSMEVPYCIGSESAYQM